MISMKIVTRKKKLFQISV